ncbi:hypothetical protein [Pararobbsia silviterrae]|uniref:hypothetical protein n=1 Tax=Pararobbsia silviterrae TaxID=1792498 RepID=UPI001313E4DB|nr:hypothetical protein [Pararobbsia silviterrae]
MFSDPIAEVLTRALTDSLIDVLIDPLTDVRCVDPIERMRRARARVLGIISLTRRVRVA